MLIDVIDEILELVKDSKTVHQKTQSDSIFEFVYSEKPYYIPFVVSVHRSRSIEDEYDDVDDLQSGMIIKNRLYLSAGATPIEDPDTIEIDIYINPTKEESVYDKLYIELIDYVSHEFRHIVQHLYNPTGIIPKPVALSERIAVRGNRYKYTLLRDESDALLYGWSQVADYTNTTLDSVIEKNINNWLELGEISKKQKKLLHLHFNKLCEGSNEI